MSAPREPTALYRLYDADGKLLYVGIAKDPESRWRQHAAWKRSTWWPAVSRKTVEWFPDRETANRAETAAINSEKPLHNRAKREGSFVVTFGAFEDLSPEIEWGWKERRPVSVQVAEILRSEIKQGVLRPGDPMPTGPDLKERFGIAPQTLYKVYRALASEGLIHQGKLNGRYRCGPVDPA